MPRNPIETAETFAQDDHAIDKMPENIKPSDAVHEVDTEVKAQGEGKKISFEQIPKENEEVLKSSNIAAQPVTQESVAETSAPSKFWPSDNCPKSEPCRKSQNHGRLAAASESCPISDASSRGREGRSPDIGAAESNSDVFRKGSCGEEFRDHLVRASGLDQVVFQPLQVEPQGRTQEDDPLHTASHRGGGTPGAINLDATQSHVQVEEHAKVTHDQGQESGRSADTLADGRGVRYRGAHDRATLDFHRDDGGSRGSPGHPSPPTRPRECNATGDLPDLPADTDAKCNAVDSLSRHCSGRANRPMGPVEDHDDQCDWSLQAGEIDQFCETIPNKEKAHFWDLVNQFEKELDHLAKNITPSTKSIDLLEVFCSDQSAITDQIQKLGGTAIRFGRTQGDLETPEGRTALFVQLLKHRPKNVWMSPTCGPWSKWSQFNSLRSLAAFDSIQQQRFIMLNQVALCLVICRYQHRQCRHAHWEQPKGSYMMRLPYIQEIYRYLISTMPDLCNAGNLRDPENQMPMQKGLQIMTSSKKMHETLHHLKCTRDHTHTSQLRAQPKCMARQLLALNCQRFIPGSSADWLPKRC